MRTNLHRRTVQLPVAIGALLALIAVTIASVTAVTAGDLENAPIPTPSRLVGDPVR